MYSLVQASTPVEQLLSKPEPATQRAGAELTAAALWNHMAGLIMFLLHRDILKTRILPVVFLFLICGLVQPDDPRGSVLAEGSCWRSRELRSSLGQRWAARAAASRALGTLLGPTAASSCRDSRLFFSSATVSGTLKEESATWLRQL